MPSVSTVSNSLRAFLATDSALLLLLGTTEDQPGIIQHGFNDEDLRLDISRIWFALATSVTSIYPNRTPMMTTSLYNVEIVTPAALIDESESSAIALNMAIVEYVKTKLNGYQGLLVTGVFVPRMIVEDHSEDYLPQSGANEGDHTTSLQIQIQHLPA